MTRLTACRRRAVSSMVPVPMTRAAGKPEASVMMRVRTSTGLLTITMMPRAPRSCVPMSLMTDAFLWRSSSLDLPGRSPPSALITTTSASSISSIGAVLTVAGG